MEIKIGVIEEAEKTEEVKDFITKTLKNVKTDKFDTIYVAYPHQAYSEPFELKDATEKTLQIFVYSVPEVLKAEITRFDNIEVNGEKVNFSGGQRDGISVSGRLPKNFVPIKDENGNMLALALSNKLWILNDLLHGINTIEVQTSATEVLNYIVDTYISPPSEEELQRRLYVKMEKIINANFRDQTKDLESEVKRLEGDVKSADRRLQELVQQLVVKNDLLTLAKMRKRPSAEEMYRKLTSMKNVRNIMFEQGNIAVKTNPIKIGPLNFGEWTFHLRNEKPSLYHQSGKMHPYEHGRGDYCLGGFSTDYYMAISQGELNKALTYCFLEVTNYDPGAGMRTIEPFLESIMGEEELQSIFDKIRKENFEKAQNVSISRINGTEVTYVGVVETSSGKKVPTVEKVVIDYGE